MHCPKSKLFLKRKEPRLTEGTMGQLSEEERNAICKEIQEGWVCGQIVFGTHAISFNLLSTRRSLN
jgi:hypothetical protein